MDLSFACGVGARLSYRLMERVSGMDTQQSAWERVSARKVCPICEHDSWCSVLEKPEGITVHCMRVKSDRPVKSGGWIHRNGTELGREYRQPKKTEVRPVIDWNAKAEQCHAAGREMRRELTVELGVSLRSLDLLGVGETDDYRGRVVSTWPERTGQLKTTGIVTRYGDGEKKMIKWSRHGLYIWRDWWKCSGPILLPEGGSDTAALISMGLSAIGRPSNIGGVNYLIGVLTNHSHRPIIVLGERDEKPEKRGQEKTKHSCPAECKGCMLCHPGLAGAKQTAEALSKALGRRILMRLPPKGAKDVREWLQANPEFTVENGLKLVSKLTLA